MSNINKNDDNNQSLVKNNESGITNSPKGVASPINMSDLARQGFEEVKKYGGEIKVRQERKIKPDGTISVSQYVGVNIPEKNLNIEKFQTQQTLPNEIKPQAQVLENQFKPVESENPIKVNQGVENFSQEAEKAVEVSVNLGNDSNSGSNENNSDGEN
jgi:hypothetical protein